MRRFKIRNIRFAGIEFEKQVRFWKGYIPVDEVDKFAEAAEVQRWGYVIEDPAEEDVEEVPTLIKTSKWAERIKPVMNFMGLVTGYKELDVSKIFLLFFTFFAGILVGDAGYGLIFILLTFLVHWKQKFVKKTEFKLMYTLSASILLWGTLTGTYFGSETIANFPFLSILRVEKLASFGGDNQFIQKFMFLVGAIHMTIGHLQIGIRYINSVKAIAQLGWVAIIWGLYLIVNQMVLSTPAPDIMIWLFIGGSVLVALFSNPGGSFLKGVLSSIGNLPLSIINGFSDTISYIRLYAVGLATVLMASSFNEMAIGDGITTVASGITAVIILILGHTLNMILAAMAILVHGVRLNMLEYAGHADVYFSGSDYDPFKLKNRNLKK
jgi:V/A-type H+-transporting ATPase subunit I